jgi:hypothetical protein
VRIAVAIFALLLTGCASEQAPVSSTPPVHREYASAPAAALAFDPPVLAGTPRVDLSRDDRGPAAFDGFADTSTTVYSLSVDDWYSDNNRGANQPTRDAYSRHSVSETLEVSHR